MKEKTKGDYYEKQKIHNFSSVGTGSNVCYGRLPGSRGFSANAVSANHSPGSSRGYREPDLFRGNAHRGNS